MTEMDDPSFLLIGGCSPGLAVILLCVMGTPTPTLLPAFYSSRADWLRQRLYSPGKLQVFSLGL